MLETLSLSDGRTLAFADTGDPEGPPVLYFHGWPASRLEAALAGGLRVRVIAPDRPGFGASSPHPGRTLLDWPRDIAALARHLGLRRFHVAGVSGGAPYALACAHALPGVAGVALVSPLPPLAALALAAPGPALRRLLWFGTHPRLGPAAMAAIRRALFARLFDPQKLLDGAAAPPDLAALTPQRRHALLAAWREGLRPGVDGAMSDARIFAAPWGFDLASVAPPVTIWHGACDRVVPPACLGAYAALRATRHLLPAEGHYSLALTRASDMLDTLVGAQEAAKSAIMSPHSAAAPR